MKAIKNDVTLALVELGRESIAAEESQLRAKIQHKTMPANNQIMAFPYPSNYGVDRYVWTNVFVELDDTGKMIVSYSVTFAHKCLLWQHSRIYSLTSEEYEKLSETLTRKYGTPKIATFDPSDHWQLYNTMQTWHIDSIYSL